MLRKTRNFLVERGQDMEDALGGSARIVKTLLAVLLIYFLIVIVLGIWWSSEPDSFNVTENSTELTEAQGHKQVTGYVTTATMIRLMDTLLNKPGGYVSNDVLPPGVWMDNMSNWEFGVLVQVRDLTRALRREISRSQSQSTEDRSLVIAEPAFHFNNDAWILPSTESEYEKGIKAMRSYLQRLADPNDKQAQFYARADNLQSWLQDVGTRLGSLSQRLSESVGKEQFDMDAGARLGADGLPEQPESQRIKTSFTEIDDVFYQARGTAYALIHLLKAVEKDFESILGSKNARVSLAQIVVELEATQATVWSPMILNGGGFGVFANHSLAMASYISRANAAIIDLRNLLENG
ncbi:MAG: hypothetical protein CME36_07595 [unclassified Hahellaceae]|nr:hypothetical protein [Hahellaceae bacterium]|tara:strand:+ start:1655 stop:2707 length:1053 start_codon:yes stop_codon:yes gene_type:complete